MYLLFFAQLWLKERYKPAVNNNDRDISSGDPLFVTNKINLTRTRDFFVA